jgi:3-phenylpropionate/trans-cinnamate dioxygenase ferredoxin reductase component
MPEPIVIVGGGLASARVVETYREAGGDAEIVLVSADTAPPYHRPPLSKRFLRGESEAEDSYVQPEEFYAAHGVDLRLETRVERLDASGRALELEGGGERLPWERLVLATGAVPRRPEIPGAELDGVTTFRWIDDAKSLRAAAEAGASAVVAGAGFIGMEISASLRTLGRDVALVYREGGLYGQFGVAELSRALEELYRERGVELIAGDTVAELRGDGRVERALLSSGREVEAEVAVFGYGVAPAVGLAEQAGIDVEDGIVVNERFETSAPSVYSAGDVAAYWDPLFGRRRRIEHWSNANYQGQQLGKLLAGEDAPYDTLSTFFTEVFGVTIKVFGDGVKPDDVVVEEGFSLEQGLAWYVRGGRIEGALVIGQSEEREAELKELIAQRPEPGAVR